MLKAIVVSAALLSAPSYAQAMEPADALMTLIKIEVARQSCGLAPDRATVTELVEEVTPYIKVGPEQFVQSVRNAAGQMGQELQRNGSLPGFCANVGRIYGSYGK